MTAGSYLDRLTWSAVTDFENFSAEDAGSMNITTGGGGIAGLASLGELFFAFQDARYTLFQHQTGDNPLEFIKTVEHGLNSFRTIQEIGGTLYYLDNFGESRITNGSSDVSISGNIKPLCNTILNNKTSKDYYGTYPNVMPNAFYDAYNRAYRLFYAGSSSYCDKCLNYFIDKGMWTSSSSTTILSMASVLPFQNYIGIIGNSSSNGISNYLVPKYADTSKVGTIDFGWLSSGNPRKQIKIQSFELWLHAEPGETAGDNCDCTITITIYDDPSTNVALGTYTTTLAYNSVADNLQKKIIKTPCIGYYLRPVITDSGSKLNYSIDKVIIDMDVLDSSN